MFKIASAPGATTHIPLGRSLRSYAESEPMVMRVCLPSAIGASRLRCLQLPTRKFWKLPQRIDIIFPTRPSLTQFLYPSLLVVILAKVCSKQVGRLWMWSNFHIDMVPEQRSSVIGWNSKHDEW